MKKRALSLLLAILMLVTVLPVMTSAANMAFKDVASDAWYFADVKNAFEKGLINGKSADKFAPEDNLTYAEAVKLAAAMNQKFTTGSVTLQNGNPWYQSYVDYCKAAGIISKDYDWNAAATRAGYMEIFSKALPDTALQAVNTVADGSIPDVAMSHPQAAAIYKLYRAGILQGSSDYVGGQLTEHLCKPNDAIRRCEVAAILTRMMDSSKRVSFSIGNEPALTVSIPATATGAANSAVSLTATVAGGKTPYTYQWQFSFDGSSWINGAVSAAYSYTVAATPATQYVRLSVTDAAGKVTTSNTCAVTVGGVLTVTIPNTFNAVAGTAVNITSTVSGGKAPYTYTWQYSLDGVNWNTGAATKDYAYSAPATPAKQYVRLTVKDADNKTVTSNTCTVSVSGLSVTTDKTGTVTIAPGDFTATATPAGGTQPYKYQWQFSSNGVDYTNIANATAAAFSYKFTTIGTYIIRVQVTDAKNQSAVSAAVTVVVSGTALAVTTDKTGTVTAAPGIFTAGATVTGGRAPYTYQWQLSTNGTNWSDIYVANAAALSYQFANAGSYILRVQVKDANGQTAASTPFTLVITTAKPLAVTTDKTGTVTMSPGTLTANATVTGGTQPYTYQWQYSADGFTYSNITGANSAKFTYNFPSAGTYIIRVQVTDNAKQTAFSSAFVLKVGAASPLKVSTDKTGTISMNPGALTVTATAKDGTQPYTYQWQYSANGSNYTDIFGAVSNVFSYNFSADGTYVLRVMVRDSGGQTVYSSPVTVKVAAANPLAVTTDKKGIISVQTGTFTAKATATGGTAPYTYQWEQGSASGQYYPIYGATKADFSYMFTGNEGSVQLRVAVTDASNKTVYSDPMLIEISGPNSPLILTLDPSGGATKNLYDALRITAKASGGDGTYSYRWEYYYEGVWNDFPTTTAALDLPCIMTGTFQVRCTVTSGVQRETDVVTVVIVDPTASN